MPLLYKGRVKEVASNKPNASTAFNLPDSAPTGFRSFDAAYATGEIMECYATNGTAWEEFIGTFTAGTPDTLTRTTLLDSSTGSAIDWSTGGDVTVFVTPSGSFLSNIDNINTLGFSALADGTNTQNMSTGTGTTTVTGGASGALKTLLWNVGGYFTQSTGVFFPSKAGKWLIGGTAVIDSVNDGKFLAVYVSHSIDGISYNVTDDKTGILWRGASSAAGLVLGGSGAIVVEANGTTDRWVLQVFHNDAGTPKLPGNAANRSWCRFWAKYLGV